MIIVVTSPFEEFELVEKLSEAKGFPALTSDDIRQAVLDTGFDINKSRFVKKRRSATSNASKKFDNLTKRVRTGLLNYTNRFLSDRRRAEEMLRKASQIRVKISSLRGKPGSEKEVNDLLSALRSAQAFKPTITRTRWMEWVKHLLRTAYHEAFEIGYQSSGAGSLRTGVAKVDQQWVRSAIQHEMRYFNRFLSQIESSRRSPEELPQSPIPIKRKSPEEVIAARMGAYVDTLRHVYYAGRVMGTPTGMVIDWISPLDRETCRGCRFLSEHSPYTKRTLPTTPRAGDTICLSNCRCRLVIRDVGKGEFESVEKRHRSKDWYRRKLARLKAGKVL